MQFQELPTGKTVQGKVINWFKTKDLAKRYIYLLAGVHGDEIEGVHVLKELFKWLQNEHLQHVPVVVIPVLNVDGLEVKTRVNARGVDLNRNLPINWSVDHTEPRYYPGPHPLSEPENLFLTKCFEQFPPGFILSFHTWKPMLNYNGNCEQVAQFLHQHNGYPVVGIIENYPTPGSLGEFAPTALSSPVLTFECPSTEEKTLTEIWQENEPGLKALFHSPLLFSFIN